MAAPPLVGLVVCDSILSHESASPKQDNDWLLVPGVAFDVARGRKFVGPPWSSPFIGSVPECVMILTAGNDFKTTHGCRTRPWLPTEVLAGVKATINFWKQAGVAHVDFVLCGSWAMHGRGFSDFLDPSAPERYATCRSTLLQEATACGARVFQVPDADIANLPMIDAWHFAAAARVGLQAMLQRLLGDTLGWPLEQHVSAQPKALEYDMVPKRQWGSLGGVASVAEVAHAHELLCGCDGPHELLVELAEDGFLHGLSWRFIAVLLWRSRFVMQDAAWKVPYSLHGELVEAALLAEANLIPRPRNGDELLAALSLMPDQERRHWYVDAFRKRACAICGEDASHRVVPNMGAMDQQWKHWRWLQNCVCETHRAQAFMEHHEDQNLYMEWLMDKRLHAAILYEKARRWDESVEEAFHSILEDIKKKSHEAQRAATERVSLNDGAYWGCGACQRRGCSCWDFEAPHLRKWDEHTCTCCDMLMEM